MKKITVLLTIALMFLLAVPAFAWSGVSGAMYDAYGDPWQHGFVVILTGTVGGVPNQPLNANGTTIPAGQHTFSVPFSITPDDNTAVSVLFRFYDGGNGRPASQLFTDLFIQSSWTRSYYPIGDFNTGTGPTAVDLLSANTTPNSMPTFAKGALLMLLSITFMTAWQRHKPTGKKQ